MSNVDKEATGNYKAQKKIVAELSIAALVKASDYINELANFISSENEVLDYLDDIQNPLVDIIRQCQTAKDCPHCGCTLYLSDIPQYEFVCPECDENFYLCEVK